MKIEINTTDIRPTNFLTKIISVLFGIFLTSSIYAIFLKAFEVHGIWIGAVFTFGLVATGFYFSKKGSRLRPIIWTMLATLIICLAAYYVGIQIISKSLEGI